jgi:hypothetical protein
LSGPGLGCALGGFFRAGANVEPWRGKAEVARAGFGKFRRKGQVAVDELKRRHRLARHRA